ncbi:ABC transporter permease [Bacillus benzoevorans]|uniref:NitT/TauT family transport system permease protein n=1 Tax=Bacillus benzoevorans TaxID=1456 RepID=A0A7X0LU73_9BACI|nr:ABC transporter permease subunit [Bacillus benzoevorans]MBB6444253.1 NitT/TauT family transport system permease protein [Bacillus benzoevorans]
MDRFLKFYVYTLVIAIVLIGLWVYITNFTQWLDPVIFPSPEIVLMAFFKGMKELLQGFVSSMGLLVPSLVLSIVLGIAGGLYFGMQHRFRAIFEPFFQTFSPLPPTLFIPYAIALFPTFKSASIFILFITTFWPIFLGTIQGVLLIDKHYWDNAKTIGLKGRDLIFRVILPASSPFILNGVGISLGFSFIVLMMAEMFGADSGMGRFIQYYTDFTQYDYVLAGIIFNSIVILAIMIIFEKVKKRLLFWTNLRRENS